MGYTRRSPVCLRDRAAGFASFCPRHIRGCLTRPLCLLRPSGCARSSCLLNARSSHLTEYKTCKITSGHTHTHTCMHACMLEGGAKSTSATGAAGEAAGAPRKGCPKSGGGTCGCIARAPQVKWSGLANANASNVQEHRAKRVELQKISHSLILENTRLQNKQVASI